MSYRVRAAECLEVHSNVECLEVHLNVGNGFDLRISEQRPFKLVTEWGSGKRYFLLSMWHPQNHDFPARAAARCPGRRFVGICVGIYVGFYVGIVGLIQNLTTVQKVCAD